LWTLIVAMKLVP